MNNIFAPYHSNQYRYRRTDLCDSIISTDVLAGFLDELLNTNIIRPLGVELKGGRIRTSEEATWVLGQLNDPQTRFMSLLNIQSQNQYWQQWTLTPSNLGRGYVFMLMCGGCGCSSKYLYLPDGQYRYLCRRCHRISYPTKQQRLTTEKRIKLNQTA